MTSYVTVRLYPDLLFDGGTLQGERVPVVGWFIPTSYEEEGRGIRRRRAIVWGRRNIGKWKDTLILCGYSGNKLKSRLCFHVAEHSSDVQNMDVYVQHRLRTFKLELSEGLCLRVLNASTSFRTAQAKRVVTT